MRVWFVSFALSVFTSVGCSDPSVYRPGDSHAIQQGPEGVAFRFFDAILMDDATRVRALIVTHSDAVWLMKQAPSRSAFEDIVTDTFDIDRMTGRPPRAHVVGVKTLGGGQTKKLRLGLTWYPLRKSTEFWVVRPILRMGTEETVPPFNYLVVKTKTGWWVWPSDA
jgi:hypothetical protein